VDEPEKFFIIYNLRGKSDVMYKIFTNMRKAIDFSQNEKYVFLDGYVHKDLNKLKKVYDMCLKDWTKDKWKEVENYSKENNIIRFLKYIEGK